ncbi:MAG: TAXI family TRAP transporter solute-binding subunit [Firmicutes bacterium]|nr:TAXI family TRAP transporter solute-binding subunit [Bacillota bacterium]
MKNLKKLVFTVTLLLLLVLTVTACGSNASQTTAKPDQGADSKTVPKVQINIGTAPSGSLFYALGIKMAELITNNIPGYTATAQPTGASVENIKRMSANELQMGYAYGGNIYYALKGEKFFTEPHDIKVLFAGHPSTWILIAPKDSGIANWTDLKGKRIGSNPPGSGMGYDIWLAILEYYKIKESDLAGVSRIQNLDDAVQQIKDGHLDGVCWPISTGGVPALTELATSTDVNWIGVDAEGIKYIIDKYPFLSAITIKAGNNKGQDKDITSAGDYSHIVVRADMPDDMAYQITKAIMDNTDALKAAVPAGADYTVENAVITAKVLPYHPGAIKYFKEKGVWKE